MSPLSDQVGAVLDRDGRLVDEDLDERVGRAIALACMVVRADQIIRDVGRLDRAWRRYQHTHPPPLPGQLDLF